MKALKDMTRDELNARAVELGMTEEQAKGYGNKELLIAAIENLTPEEEPTEELVEETVEEATEETVEETVEEATEETVEETVNDPAEETAEEEAKRSAKLELDIMKRYGVDEIWLNDAGEYFTTENFAKLSGDKQPLRITKESLTSN